MSELLPCPFCGGEAEILGMKVPPPLPWLRCKSCGAETRVYATEAEAIAAWNTRAEMSYQDALILLDELGMSERTCNEYGSIRVWQSCNVWSHELSCGHEVDTLEKEPPNYCPNCGARVEQ